MGDFIKFLFFASIMMSFVLAGLAGFILVLNLMVSLIFVTMNQNVIADTFAMINIWLPFNLAPIWFWLTSASFAFLGYRLALIAYTWISRIIGKG